MTQILVDIINPLTPEDEIATLTSDDHQPSTFPQINKCALTRPMDAYYTRIYTNYEKLNLAYE